MAEHISPVSATIYFFSSLLPGAGAPILVPFDVALGCAHAGGVHRTIFFAPSVVPGFSTPVCGAGPVVWV
jgi:hypothetical protein